jgi:hypothetical protein
MSAPCPSRSDVDSVFTDLLDAVAPHPSDIAVLIQSYFDESWDEEILCVAGYIFSSAHARKLDEEWRRMLWRNGRLPYFRMSACNRGSEPFDKLDEAGCIKAQTDAIGLISKYASYGMAVTVDQAAFYRVLGTEGFTRSPYEFCTWSVLTAVLSWMVDHDEVKGASFFFEAGHQHQSQAQFIMNRLFTDAEQKARYRYKAHAFVDKKASRPSQAADLLSWQWYKDCQRRRNGATKPRADCRALTNGTPHHVLHFDEPLLHKLVAMMDERAGVPGKGNEVAAMAIRDPSALLAWQMKQRT